MNYKVVPFTAQVKNKGTMGEVAQLVQSAIQQEATAGWEFVSCGNIDTVVEGTSGCFGFGAKPGGVTSVMVLVFRK